MNDSMDLYCSYLLNLLQDVHSVIRQEGLISHFPAEIILALDDTTK